MRDPVCGMQVDPSNATTADYHGQTFYFCCEACRDAFTQHPDRYAGNQTR